MPKDFLTDEEMMELEMGGKADVTVSELPDFISDDEASQYFGSEVDPGYAEVAPPMAQQEEVDEQGQPVEQDHHFIPNWKVGKDEQPLEMAAKGLVRPAVNIVANTGRNLEDLLYHAPAQTIGMYKEHGAGNATKYIAEGFVDTGKKIGKGIYDPLAGFGNFTLGAFSAGVKKLTGVDLNTKDTKQAYDKGVNILKNEKAETVGKAVEDLYKWTQESPEQVALSATGINKTLTKVKGAPVDIVSTTSKVVSVPAKAAAKKTLNIIVNPVKQMEKLENAYRQSLNLTPRMAQIEEKWARNTPKFLAKEGIVLESKGGKLDPTRAIDELSTKAAAENAAFKAVLKSSGKYADLNEFERRALESANQLKGTARQRALEHARAEVAAYRSQGKIFESNGKALMKIDEFNEIKQDLWFKSKKVFGNPDADMLADQNFRMGHVAKTMIEEVVDDANIRMMNSRLGDFASAIRILEKRAGTVMRGGKMTRFTSRIVGGLVGSQGGPLGTLSGAITGDKLAQLMADPKISTMMTRALIQRLEKQPNGYSVIAEAEKILAERGARVQAIPKLDAPQPLGSARNPIVTPPPKTPTTFEPAAQKINRSSSRPDTLALPDGGGRVAADKVITPPAPTTFEAPAPKVRSYSFNPKDKTYYPAAGSMKQQVQSEAVKYVQSTAKIMKDYLDDPDMKASGVKVTPAMIADIQKNIVDGIASQTGGGISQSVINAIKGLNPERFTSIDAFVEAAIKYVKNGGKKTLK